MSLTALGQGASGFNFDAMAKRQKEIAQGQVDYQKESDRGTKTAEVTEGVGSLGATMSGVQKTKDLVKTLTAGPDLVKQALGNIESRVGELAKAGASTGRQVSNMIPGLSQNHAVPQSAPSLPDLPSLPGMGFAPSDLKVGGVPTPRVGSGPDMDGTTDRVAGGFDRIRTTINSPITPGGAKPNLPSLSGVVEDAKGATNDVDSLAQGAKSLGTTVVKGAQDAKNMVSGVANIAEKGMGVAEGVVDAMGPIGDIVGLGMGIFGAVEAHKQHQEEQDSEAAQQKLVSNLPTTTTQMSSGSVGASATNDSSKMMQQSAQHY